LKNLLDVGFLALDSVPKATLLTYFEPVIRTKVDFFNVLLRFSK